MTPADSARLSLAKRAYQATQPSEHEVQTGVRRARLSLRRPKPRRSWWMKGLVFVVLALGSLAYAKPHALGELVERGAPLLRGTASNQRGASVSARADETTRPAATASALSTAPAAGIALTEPSITEPSITEPSITEPSITEPSITEPAPAVRRATKPRPSVTVRSTTDVKESRPATTDAPTSAPAGSESVSEWGRVGQALARGDEAGALSALGKLAESDDARTRDKADLGRAQLLMAHGQREQACGLARSLTHRRAGGHIERQALMLLKDCSR